MRVRVAESAEEDDAYVCWMEVFLDGVRQTRLLLADEDEGLVVRDVSRMTDGIPEGAETRWVGDRLGVVYRGQVVIRDMRQQGTDVRATG